MGNQLTGIAPSQILPVEHYLTDVQDYEFTTSLGSTRFLKVAQAHCKSEEGPAVVKVFVIQDPSLPLKIYYDQLEEIKARLQGASNCLPFQKALLMEKAALLFRQYVKDSLYDRISTRPFLNHIEKKWLAFQLLCALNQCHKLGVCHGDIKSENVMVTSWNWLLLADFASFKPTYLPEDNPADFSYFFDTSRRRTCYLAPERFVESSWRTADVADNSETTEENNGLDLTSSEVKKGDLTPGMDIFSVGCVIIELFSEGSAPFDLSQLLAYRTGEFTPWKLLQKIEDPDIRELVKHMIQKDPSSRKTADEYLTEQRGKSFPEYFYHFLKLYLQRFATTPILGPDERIMRIKRDLALILKNLDINETDSTANSALVLVISFLTANLRNLHHCNSKLTALDIMLTLSQHVTSDIILDRLIPFMLFLVNDPFPQVRAEAVATITQCLANVKAVPISDANIFPEYILPQMTHLTQDRAAMVRVAYAENIALLAETALRFLEIVQLNNTPKDAFPTDIQEISQYKASYDVELQALHEMIQAKVVTLLSDPDNIVKQTLLQSGITRLCVFFGRQKANDVLLSHMITFLNDKYDWHLRGAFFDSIVGVASYVGWHSSSILKPLLQQGLSDMEEYVIHKSLTAVTSLAELGLLQKTILHELLTEIVPFFCHPNMWIRQGAVGFVSAVGKKLNIADVHCNLLPLIQPFLKHSIIQVEEEVILLNALVEPISRTIYDYTLRSSLIEALFGALHDRQLIRNISRHGHQPNYGELEESLASLFRKLLSQGLTPADEDKLLALKEFMLKLNRARASSTDSAIADEDSSKAGNLDLSCMSKVLTRRHAELIKPLDPKTEGQPTPVKRPTRGKKATHPQSPSTLMNEDWKQMFGSMDPERAHLGGAAGLKSKLHSTHLGPPGMMVPPGVTTSDITMAKSQAQGMGSPSVSQSTVAVTMSQVPVMAETWKKVTTSTSQMEKAVQVRYVPCKLQLRNLVYKKREQYQNDQVTTDLLDHATWENRPPPSNWKPRGLLVAHLHEHRGAVNRIQVNQDHSYFATCSNDGTVKIWDCSRMEGKSVTNRSRHTYNKQGGQIKSITFCDSSQSIASASDSGAIHVFRVEASGPRISILHTKNLDVEQEGQIMDMYYFDTGSQNVITYATVHGLIIGWDIRMSKDKTAWTLRNDPKHGLVSSFSVHPMLSWLAVGTSSGMHVCWDMRFQLPITTVPHPTGARVRRLLTHPTEQSCVISSVQGNNEVSLWDLETAARQKTLWASTAPALSQTQASSHSVNGMHLGVTDSNTFLLTAGSDMRLRYWDLTYPANSHIVAPAAADPTNQTVVSYRSRLIEGTEVIQETYSKPRMAQTEDIPRRGPDQPALGHHDIITDVNICMTSQCFVVTCSRDGVVKVWK